MAYGLHWEWRGFGEVPPETERRIAALRSAGMPDRTVTDSYLWAPGVTANVKIRAWPGGGSLKVKRLIARGDPHGPSLWREDPDEDYAFPISPAVLARCLAAVGMAAPSSPPPVIRDPDALYGLLRELGGPLRLVEVSKRRRTFVWDEGPAPLLVELAEISAPESTRSVGLEDAAGLSAEASDADVDLARRAVSEAVPMFGEALHHLTYPQAVAVWVRGGSVVVSGGL